jgi:hypothetical protein
MNKANTEEKVDKAVDLSFPASDATAHGKPTSTEPCAAHRPEGSTHYQGADRASPARRRPQTRGASEMDANSKPVDRPERCRPGAIALIKASCTPTTRLRPIG